MTPIHYYEKACRRLLCAVICFLAFVLFVATTVSLALTPSLCSWSWSSGSLALAFALFTASELRAALKNYQFYLSRK